MFFWFILGFVFLGYFVIFNFLFFFCVVLGGLLHVLVFCCFVLLFLELFIRVVGSLFDFWFELSRCVFCLLSVHVRLRLLLFGYSVRLFLFVTFCFLGELFKFAWRLWSVFFCFF